MEKYAKNVCIDYTGEKEGLFNNPSSIQKEMKTFTFYLLQAAYKKNHYRTIIWRCLIPGASWSPTKPVGTPKCANSAHDHWYKSYYQVLYRKKSLIESRLWMLSFLLFYLWILVFLLGVGKTACCFEFGGDSFFYLCDIRVDVLQSCTICFQIC